MTRRLANGDKARELAKVAERRGHLVRHVLRCGPQRARVFFTCVHCLHVSRTVSALGRLKGSCGGAGERERALQTTGKQKLYVGVGVQGRRVLKRLWGLSDKEHACLMVNARRLSAAAPLKQWLRDVTEEGIEPHPGPSSSASSHLPGTYMYLNVGGCTNAFAALDLVQALDDQPAVWGLAEVRASPNEQAALTRRASQMGFRTWWISSTQGARQHGMPNGKGGLCVGVHEDICCLLMAAWQHEEGELVTLDFRHFKLMVAWRRPDCTRDAFDVKWRFGLAMLRLRVTLSWPVETGMTSRASPLSTGSLCLRTRVK